MAEEATMVESSVESAPEVGNANVFAFGPEEGEEPAVDTQEEAEPVGEEEQVEETSETVVGEESSESVNDSAPRNQKDINAAIGKEKERIRKQAQAEYEKKLKSDPSYLLGKMMADDLMSQEDGLSEEDAVKKAMDNFVKAVAKRDGISPNIAKKLYNVQEPQHVETQQERIDRIVSEVQQAYKPEGFDESVAYNDEAFLSLLDEMPASAAIRVYMAEKKANNAPQDIAEKLRARQSIPQSIRPQKPVAPKTDWTKVSSDDFKREKERRNKIIH